MWWRRGGLGLRVEGISSSCASLGGMSEIVFGMTRWWEESGSCGGGSVYYMLTLSASIAEHRTFACLCLREGLSRFTISPYLHNSSPIVQIPRLRAQGSEVGFLERATFSPAQKSLGHNNL